MNIKNNTTMPYMTLYKNTHRNMAINPTINPTNNPNNTRPTHVGQVMCVRCIKISLNNMKM